MTTQHLSHLALSLVVTILFEVAFYLIVCKRNAKDALLVVLVNIITNPAAQLTYWMLLAFTEWHVFAIKLLIEVVVIFWEGVLFMDYSQGIARPFYFAVGVNAVSFGLGELLLIHTGILELIILTQSFSVAFGGKIKPRYTDQD